MSKEVLIITNYFPPETGAASNRIHHLAYGLKNKGFEITVLTPLPNYPKGRVFNEFRGKFRVKSVEENITIHRLWIYASNSRNKILRLVAMLSYSVSLISFFVLNKIPKTVIVQSPPLIVAFVSVLFLRSRKRKLILNVSDLWPIAGLELGALKEGFGYNILKRIERFNYKYSQLVLGQSIEILDHVKSLFPCKETLLYRNFPDFSPKKIEGHKATGKVKLVYAGLLGVAQGIYKLVQELEYSNIEFHIYGSGAEQSQIESYLRENPKLPITYYGEVSRIKLHKILANYDLTIIPLLNRIYGSVPSKIFEYARLGLPMLYFGGGEGETIVKNNGLGWVSEPGDYSELNKTLKTIKKEDLSLRFKVEIQKIAIEKFAFEPQLERLISRL